MKIGFDIDGTLQNKPKFYSFLIKILRYFNIEIIVITGRSRFDGIGLTDFQMRTWDIRFDKIFLREDYENLVTEADFAGNLDKQIGVAKARLCKKLGVYLMVDDMEEVIEACKAEGVMYWKA